MHVWVTACGFIEPEGDPCLQALDGEGQQLLILPAAFDRYCGASPDEAHNRQFPDVGTKLAYNIVWDKRTGRPLVGRPGSAQATLPEDQTQVGYGGSRSGATKSGKTSLQIWARLDHCVHQEGGG